MTTNAKTAFEQWAEQIEHMLDHHAGTGAEAVAFVLSTLADICRGKGEHIRHNWQDDAGATTWERWARIIDAAEAKVLKS